MASRLTHELRIGAWRRLAERLAKAGEVTPCVEALDAAYEALDVAFHAGDETAYAEAQRHVTDCISRRLAELRAPIGGGHE